jgi:tetratricopeptide (TPR) repeat protein
MKRLTLIVLTAACMLFVTSPADAQIPGREQEEKVDRAMDLGADLMDQKKYADALEAFKEALSIIPDEPSILYNVGLAAYHARNYEMAVRNWKALKAIDPSDGMLRSKLTQAYQAMGALKERDMERAELMDLWRSGKDQEFAKQPNYCRDQFEAEGKRVMAFEHFELKGDRALRYVFVILNKTGDSEEFRISLGSYDATNAVWRETTKPAPKPDERLFHLDGYFSNGHATYGMFFPEPSYDETKLRVLRILEGKGVPISSSTIAAPTRESGK